MLLSNLIEIVDTIAPPNLAMPDDPIGMHLGSPATKVERVLVCLDVTDKIARQAHDRDVDAIFCHHPLIYHPIQSLAEDNPANHLIAQLIRDRLAVYSLHTNWDAADDGLNHALARSVGLRETEPLDPTYRRNLVKLVVFVPLDSVDRVAQALGKAGAGHIGKYSHCSFRTQGVGTFLPGEGTNPHIGSTGELECVDEIRLETIVPEDLLDKVTDAMTVAHPYEEVAYDLYDVRSVGQSNGIGLIGNLNEAVPFSEFIARVDEALGHPGLRARGDLGKTISTVAVCGGSGGDLIDCAVARGADAYVTADIPHHLLLHSEALGLGLVDGTHYATEIIGMEHFANRLRNQIGSDIEVIFAP